MAIGRAAADARRAIGLTAWCTLEVLATIPIDNGELWIVRSSVRAVAASLGVAPNTPSTLAILRASASV